MTDDQSTLLCRPIGNLYYCHPKNITPIHCFLVNTVVQTYHPFCYCNNFGTHKIQDCNTLLKYIF